MKRWLRVVMPPLWTVLAAAFCYFSMEIFCLAAERRLDMPFYSLDVDRILVATMAFFAVSYAVYRVWAFHPAFRPVYSRWLAGTPWTSRKQLPLGPVHLVLQDVLFLAMAVALCWPRAGVEALVVLQAFLTCYLALLASTFVSTREKAWAYAVAFGLGAMGLFALSPLYYVAAGITYVIALLGLRASLAHFPWRDLPPFPQKTRLLNTNGPLGWPYDRLGPGMSKDNQFTVGDALVLGLLAGWWFFVGAYHLNTHAGNIENATLAGSFLLAWEVFARICLYCHGYAPPLSLRGRIAHGRLITPGYDRVFVAPLLAVLVFVAVLALPLWSGVPELIALPIGVMASTWIVIGMGPGLNDWHLTGNHRIVKGFTANAGQRNR